MGRLKTAYNRRLAKKRVQCLNEVLCFVSSSVLEDSFDRRNPLFRQGPKLLCVMNNSTINFKMSTFKITIFLIQFALYSTTLIAQTNKFKRYSDTVHKFSIDIPSYWTIKYSKEQEGVICIPTTKVQKDIYRNCFEGIVFRLDFFNYGLDTLLQQQFDKDGENYITTDRISHNVPVKFIKGNNWTGIRHDNVCGINCTDNGFQAGAGECQFFYFSNGRTTIEIQTNGRLMKKY